MIEDPNDTCDYWFLCKKCYSKFNTITDFKGHIDGCKSKKVKFDSMDELNEEIKKLKTTLLIEKNKTKILGRLVEKQYDVDLADIIEDTKKPPNPLPVIDPENSDSDKPAKKKTVGKPRFSKLKKTIAIISDQSDDEKTTKTNPDMAKVYNKVNQLYDLTLPELESKMRSFMDIHTSKLSDENIKEFKNYRYKLLRYVKVETYRDILFRLQHKIPNNPDIFTPFELRLIKHPRMSRYIIDFDELEKYTIGIEHMQKEKLNHEMTVFEPKKIIGFFIDPRVAFDDISQIVEKFFRYNESMIVYLPQTTKDPYSFYCLEKIEGGNKCWTMDCRLEIFGTDLSEHLNEYCKEYFRELYKSIFGNNSFHTNFLELSRDNQKELIQLLKNIYNTTNPVRFSRIIGEVISRECIIIPTDNDKFNLTGDNKAQKTRFITTPEKVNMAFSEIFNEQLFDSADKTGINEFVENFIKTYLPVMNLKK